MTMVNLGLKFYRWCGKQGHSKKTSKRATYQASVQEQYLNTRFALRNRDGSFCALPHKTRHKEPMEVNKFVGIC